MFAGLETGGDAFDVDEQPLTGAVRFVGGESRFFLEGALDSVAALKHDHIKNAIASTSEEPTVLHKSLSLTFQSFFLHFGILGDKFVPTFGGIDIRGWRRRASVKIGKGRHRNGWFGSVPILVEEWAEVSADLGVVFVDVEAELVENNGIRFCAGLFFGHAEDKVLKFRDGAPKASAALVVLMLAVAIVVSAVVVRRGGAAVGGDGSVGGPWWRVGPGGGWWCAHGREIRWW